MLNSLPKVIASSDSSYHLVFACTDNIIHVYYAPFYHEDRAVFSYWASYGKEQILVEKTLEFIQKWLDDGNVIVRE